jgi:phospholipid/cholesterol/gamma-HCH transport system substrate-binding protein
VLTSLDELSDVAVGVIQGTQQNTRASLEALRPILNQLNAAGADFPNSLELLTTYPFPRTIDQGIKGDYANLFVTLDLDLAQVLQAECGGTPLEPICAPVGGVIGGGQTAQSEGPAPAQPAPVDPGVQPQQVPVPQQPAVPTLPAVPVQPVPTPNLDQVVPAPGGGGSLSDLFNGVRSGSSGGGGLLGLLMGGMR